MKTDMEEVLCDIDEICSEHDIDGEEHEELCTLAQDAYNIGKNSALADLAKERERAEGLQSQYDFGRQLIEVGRDERDALRAELAECRAELRREHEANAHDPVRQKLKAAEARAARYETTLREMRSQCVRGAHSDDDRIIDTIDAALAALAETEKEKP